ncbi:UDP-4-amino-4,6-dideoxy-N-acetyl-beta-L-altrosamine transaminase [Marinicauda algicola]|uniref:UDP-4-amino-4, 6-dideoxy-N-acetyl-beta-L-altrosamine transaminase n=1 Tax=Marinicauda algicola TaxID=2029849 RepID=A0A4S2GW77_9PROT|nr:UDP-4-amino-4,6-dideoxy-N-acetyl-beta-L-altrosamine transaminase [Marinicauda algicola]TGY87254.1 UDP-4-amino-4,6-dideoxy-N-acetyl-beta-L-altrosamine transaminase [Marinicauda algicola]
MSDSFLPYGRQVIEDDDIEAVARVLRSDYLTTGPEIPAFEAEFSRWHGGAVHCIACNSATAGLHLALDALGVAPGDVCIVPSLTFLATANAARYCGAEVVFADVDPQSGLMTPATLDAAILRARTRFSGARLAAVLPVHLAGLPCDLETLHARVQAEGAVLVADSCHALASRWTDAGGQSRLVGDAGFCDAAVFSFHPVKTLACGEGGMVTTRHEEAAETMRRRRSHGIERDPVRMGEPRAGEWPWYHEMGELGWNYRMPDINAALGRSQLAKLSRFAARRRELTSLYEEALKPLAPLVLPPAGRAETDSCRHLMNVRIDFEAAGVARETVMERLKDRGVGSQVHYIPVHTQPYYTARYGPERLPGADTYYARTLSLPLYPAMADDDPARVAGALAEALEAG